MSLTDTTFISKPDFQLVSGYTNAFILIIFESFNDYLSLSYTSSVTGSSHSFEEPFSILVI